MVASLGYNYYPGLTDRFPLHLMGRGRESLGVAVVKVKNSLFSFTFSLLKFRLGW